MGILNLWKKRPRKDRRKQSRLMSREGRRLRIEGLEHRQLLSVCGSQPGLSYYLKPVTGGANVGTAPIVSSTGDYQGGGTAGTAFGNPYTVVLDQSAASGQTVKLEVYVSVFGTDADPTNDGYLAGALDILNHPGSTALIGKPGQVSLLPDFKGYGYSRGKVQGEIGTPDGGPDLGGPLNVDARPGSNGSWVIPRATNPVFGTNFNDNGWVDIKLGTVSFTIGDNLASGASTELWAQRVVYSGWEPIHSFLADSTDAREMVGSNGGSVLTGPAVTILMAGEPDSGTDTTETTSTQTTETQTDDSDPFADILARETPDPHPTGDRPSGSARSVALTAYTPAPIFDPGIPELAPFIDGLRQIQANILKNPDARPSYWGEVLATGGGEYRLHFNDNGMLITQWTVNWGDGSDPQAVSNRPWVVHQYPGGAGQYQVTVTTTSVNGTYSGGAGGSTGGAASEDFHATGGSMTDSMDRGDMELDWVDPIGSNGGQTTTNFTDPPGYDQASAIALDNGNILVVGTTGDDQFGLVRYYDQPGTANDGELDTNFGTSGLVTTTFTEGTATASAVAVDGTNSTIVVAGTVLDGNGHKRVALARYDDADGDPDTAFNGSGKLTTDLGTGWEGTSAVVVQSDGSILVAGSMNGHFALLHYASNGTRDTSYGGAQDGIVTADFGGTNETATAMALDSSGRILVAGTSTQTSTGKDFALARFLANGTLDSSFGTVTTDFVGEDDEASAMALQPNDGKIVLAGYSDDGTGYKVFALARYDTSGNPDTFGTSGTATMDFGDGNDRATGVKVQYDGRIVVSGSTLLDGSGNVDVVGHFALARFNSDGTPDSTFGMGEVSPAGTVTSDFTGLGYTSDSASGLILDTTGRLVVAGTAVADTYSSFAVACFDPGESGISVQASDVPPVLTVVADQQANENESLNLSEIGTFTHSSVTGDFDYQIDWGDGSDLDTGTATIVSEGSQTAPLVGSFGGQHTYDFSGIYHAAVTITDPDGGSDTQTFLVMVNASPTFLTASIPDGTVNVGQSYTLPEVLFTDSSLLDQHWATVDWGDDATDYAYPTEPYFDDSLLVAMPGALTSSHVYAEDGDYNATITLYDASGATATKTFIVHVGEADVTLTGFSTDGHLLQVAYSVNNATSAPFQIGIYSSTDGVTPDQLLGSYPVGTVDSNELTVGPHTVSISPPTEDVAGDYSLIAVADSDLTFGDNTRAFAGGIFRADDGTAYVFGTDTGDTATVETTSLALNDTPFILTSTPTAIHVRTAGGDDTVTVDTGVTAPLQIFGGAGNDIITDGGSGGDLLDGGDGQNILHTGDGPNSPQIVDDSELGDPNVDNRYLETGTGWSDSAAGTGFNGTQRILAASSTAVATWMFDNLDTSAYYDLYVTWARDASAADDAAFVVKDDDTPIAPIGQTSTAPVDQTAAPADDYAAGVFWRHLGLFQTLIGTLNVQLGADSSAPVLADAVRLVKHTQTAATNLVLNSFSISTEGLISVAYTVNGPAAAPFTIGIYGSPDGSTPGTLLQTIAVEDSSLLTGSGATHTATIDAALGGLSETDFLLAKLDINGGVYQQNRADDISTPVSGIFQQDDGSIYVVGNAISFANSYITITQDTETGDVTVSTTDPFTSETFSDVTSVNISTPGGGNTITVDSGVTVPVWVLGGSGTSVTGPTANVAALRLDGPSTGSITEGQSVSLVLQSATDYGAIANWYIAWGDGTYSTNVFSHQYTSGYGTYTVSATADDTNGVSYTCPNTIPVGVLPSAPGSFSATANSQFGSTQIDLSWTNTSSLATGYRLEMSANGSDYTLVATLGNVQSYTVENLTASTHYYFRVCAVDDAGRSAYATSDATTNSIPSGTVPYQDDNPSLKVDIGMNLNFYGVQFSQVWVNNNGNLTTGRDDTEGMYVFTPDAALGTGYSYYGAIIAPFFADVDTRHQTNRVGYAQVENGVDGRPAWKAYWNGVDYYNVEASGHTSQYNTFNVTLVDRSDVTPGDFDIIFNYGSLNWDTGDASGGRDGFADTGYPYHPYYPARAGYSNGSGEDGTWYELSGSGQDRGLLGLSGDYKYEIRNPTVGLTACRTGGNYGVAVSTADQRSGDPSNYVILVNDNIGQAVGGDITIDNDVAHIALQQVQSPRGTTGQTCYLILSNAASARIYDSSGNPLNDGTTQTQIAMPGLLTGSMDVYVEGLQADPDFSLTYSYVDSQGGTEATASVHMAIADISVVDINGSTLSLLGVSWDLPAELPPLDRDSLVDLYQSLASVEFKTRIDGLHSGQIQQVVVASDAGDWYQDSLMDSASGAQSALFAVLTDNGGHALTSTQQAAIRSYYNMNALDPPDNITVKVETPKDKQEKKVAVNNWERNLTEQEQKFMYFAFQASDQGAGPPPPGQVWAAVQQARRKAIRDRLKDVKLVDYKKMMQRNPVDIFKNLLNVPRELLGIFNLAVNGAAGITLGNRVYLYQMPNMNNVNDFRMVYHELVHTIEQSLTPNWFNQYISDFVEQKKLGNKNAYMGIPAELRAYAFEAAINDVLLTPKFQAIYPGIAKLTYAEIDRILDGGARPQDKVYEEFANKFRRACFDQDSALRKKYHLDPPPAKP